MNELPDRLALWSSFTLDSDFPLVFIGISDPDSSLRFIMISWKHCGVYELSRRKALTIGGFVGSTVLAGCLDELADDTSESEELREQWEENDDYPDDEFRNLALNGLEFGAFRGGAGGRVETTFGYYMEPLYLDDHREYYRSVSVEVLFESSKPVDVYAIPGQIELEGGSFPDLSEYEHIPEYSEFGTESYQEVFETTQEDETYTLLITLADFRPPQTTQEEFDFVEERDEAVLEGQKERAAYVPFEAYNENETAKVVYDDTGFDDSLNDD